MKINKVNKPSMNGTSKANGPNMSEQVKFQEMMNEKRDKNQSERFTQMLDKVEKQGKKLAEKQTVANLLEYKKMVKEFVNEAVDHGLKLEKQGGFRRGGKSKIFKIIKKIDEKLLEITDEIISTEKKGIDILSSVGEVQGMLVNIYA